MTAAVSLDHCTMVFIAGLHRSGTSQLHSSLATHPAVSGFAGTSVPHDEGQHLQDVFPTARAHGGPGRFAFDPEAHLTEDSPLATPEAAQRLVAQWAPHWDLTRQVLIEKSPPNLIRMRFFQALFPQARFLVILRNPVTTALATTKLATTRWMRRTRRRPETTSIVDHWFAAHRILLEDLPHVRAARVIRWEDLRDDPDGTFAGIASFAGVADRFERPRLDPEVDRRYQAQWDELRRSRSQRAVVDRVLAHREEAARFGYDLEDLTTVAPLRAAGHETGAGDA